MDSENRLRRHEAAIRGKQGNIVFDTHLGIKQRGVVIGYPESKHLPLQVKTGPNTVTEVYQWNVLQPAIPKQ